MSEKRIYCTDRAQTDSNIFAPMIKQDHNFKEQEMSKISYNHKFTAAAFGAAVLFSMLSFGSSAEAASVFSCKGTSLKKVADCCEQIVKENGRPLWMTQAGATCRSVAVCWKKYKRCGIQYKFTEKELDDGDRGLRK